jgi:hypothetical protein
MQRYCVRVSTRLVRNSDSGNAVVLALRVGLEQSVIGYSRAIR